MTRIRPAIEGRAHALAAAALLALTGCQTPPPRPPPKRPPPAAKPKAPPPPQAGPEMFAATAIADLESDAALIYFARRKDGAMLVSLRGDKLEARATTPDGAPRGAAATELATAASGGGELVVGSLRPTADGYVLVWAERAADRTKVAAIAITPEGAARGPRADLAEMDDEVSFVDVVPRPGGALALWERAGQGNTVDLMGAPIDEKGAAAGTPSALLSGVLRVVNAPNGGALAAVVPAANAGKGDDDSGFVSNGKVVLVPLDASGKAGPQIEISASPTAQPDVIVAEVGDRLVLAWTDVREIDAAVWTAAVDKKGAIVSAPRRATPPTGEQALVNAAGAPVGGAPVPRGLLAWEDVLRAPPDTRQLHLATLGPDGSIGKERALVTFADGGATELTCDEAGFAALTVAPAWQGGPPPKEAPPMRTFVRFGADLSVLSAEPVRASVFGADGVPYDVQGLTCAGGSCAAFGTGGENPAKVALVTLVSRKTEWYAPAEREPDDVPPRAAALTAVYNGEQISRIAVNEVDGGHLAAWVTYRPEGDPSERAKKDGGAELWLANVPAGAKAGSVTPVQLSKKAVSVGGIAMAPAQGGKPEWAIAWVAREKGESQVYVTKVDAAGKKLAQKKVTVVARPKAAAIPSEASDVAIAWSPEGGEGWVVSWVDTRDGNAELYAAKVDRGLTKTIPDKRITDARGDAAEVALLPRGADLLVAWSDARQKPEEGKGDIFVARLDAKTLAKQGNEQRLAATPTHSRSPQLVLGPSGAPWATWVEDGGDEASAGGAVRFAVLDAQGSAVTTGSLPGSPERPVVSAAIACTDKACRSVVARAQGDALVLEALTLGPTAQPGSTRALLNLPGAGAADISPVFADRAGTSLFFGADAAAGTGRVRRLRIDW